MTDRNQRSLVYIVVAAMAGIAVIAFGYSIVTGKHMAALSGSSSAARTAGSSYAPPATAPDR